MRIVQLDIECQLAYFNSYTLPSMFYVRQLAWHNGFANWLLSEILTGHLPPVSSGRMAIYAIAFQWPLAICHFMQLHGSVPNGSALICNNCSWPSASFFNCILRAICHSCNCMSFNKRSFGHLPFMQPHVMSHMPFYAIAF